MFLSECLDEAVTNRSGKWFDGKMLHRQLVMRPQLINVIHGKSLYPTSRRRGKQLAILGCARGKAAAVIHRHEIHAALTVRQ